MGLYSARNQVWSSPTIADGKVYIGSSDNKVYAFAQPPLRLVSGLVGITANKLMFKETINNPSFYSMTIDYHWSFSVDKWNGAQWVASGISGSPAPVVSYFVPALITGDLPYSVYLLPTSGPNAVAWGDCLRINFTFNWTYSGTVHSNYYSAKLHVHLGDIAGAGVTLPYFGSDTHVGIDDVNPVAWYW
jgi:hypothetical protein